ncbi:MAG: UDP-3-O-(3-hydroxymyristoyl)glucosamine N-acyltransferase [Candidatus Brocadia sp. AMX2]|uniref:UDP-3-O-acylglucosamine N-acyltransferase n=1 Tax=Candidatus Brocadia sinica JPN1 TaxID=1197129 RepID=A0ABQ0JTG2_9BACT|nr:MULTISPECIES: UDP-3-O-(3-hydroxymyristoyl)glucosamine N-acyltransferase [Brocadia]MBC6931951.1 UDP-3-O-(3-hydroxymyristoyl)glucosamine N-acyltransferase [Candidatus Brocadia sp.]MBL1168284.1 UDP-3-O-(3-hydroxymyristoyl)glucosamine N-acyltransferase [Candidatus Brocadia sp. AMX1]MCK6468293.1 UDP-3-O-(3-hydroxymyristoyl)glucosamine N-acyltransferase [Candidatus Brocadia sinica]KAA0243455.1 MAG: UDP-3-O-(3-hydroxymyristoyl)glucosamine N-acyltransferase [Candidatus Brocadia sp. AMX2]MCE7866169.
MEKTLQELSEYVGGTVIGDPSIKIRGVMGIDDAQEGYITFISNDKYIKKIDQTKASAIIVSPKLKDTNPSLSQKRERSLLVCNNPYLAFAKLVELLMYKKPTYTKGIDDSARIDKTAVIGQDVSIRSYVTVGQNTHIGNRVVLYPCVYIGDNCIIGDDTIIYPNAVIYDDTVIGKRVTIHGNTVIGSSGFGYAPDGQSYYKIPQVGTTVIEDDVDIGANTTINRAVLGETIIRKGTKIDSQVVISHNVEVGENSLIVSQVGIAGSARIGKHVTLAGGAGIVGHIQIGDNVTVGGYSGVINDIPSNETYLGAPALPIKRMRRCYVIIEKLPEMREYMKTLEKRIKQLEERNNLPQNTQNTQRRQ